MATKRKSKSGSRSKEKKSPSKDLSALAFPPSLTENQIISELRQTVQKLRIFDSLGKALTSSLDLSEILRMIVEKLGGLIESKHFALVLLDENSSTCFFEYPSSLKDRLTFRLNEGLMGRALERGKGGLFLNPALDPVYDRNIDGQVVPHPTSMILLPIMSKGSVLGLLAFFTNEGEPMFTDEKFRTLEVFSDYLAIAIENARNYKSVKELTVTDDLTKLYNSRYLHLVLERELARSERYKENFSLVFMDVDNFKNVNDQYGHMIGSQLIMELGNFLLSVTRTSDVAIRYGGDEFVLVLPRTTKKEAILVVSRAREALREHLFLKSKQLKVKMTASFGISTFPEDGRTIDQLIAAADRAMYLIKKGDKDGVLAANTAPITLVGSDLQKKRT